MSRTSAERRTIRHVRVVVPAHNEQTRIGACLVSVVAALEEAECRGVGVELTVVLDSCSDRTAEESARFVTDGAARILSIEAGSVGRARAYGASDPLPVGLDPDQVWMMTTDADTVVPPDWVVQQLQCAGRHDLVVGRVLPEPGVLSPAVLEAWLSRHRTPFGHVHGANLGMRLSAYRAVGGFLPVDEHEDVALVAAMRSSGVAWTHATTVVTSARENGRVPGGFSGYLRALAAEAEH